MPKKTKKSGAPTSKPYCFLSYSSKEPQIKVLIPCIWIAISSRFDLKLTPTGLEAGASQLAQILKLIKGCDFAIVALDGLRPNVVFEYGLLEASEKPVILLKEKTATVDIRSYLADAASLTLEPPKLAMDSHFSNVKDLTCAEWDRDDPASAVKTILHEYRKKREKIKNFIDITDPELWST